MSPSHDPLLSRWQRLLEGCRKGLQHDLPNQLVALHGLLQLLELDEGERLSATGKDYLRRLLGVVGRIEALAQTMREMIHLTGAAPAATVVGLAEVVTDVLAEVPAPAACSENWEAPRVLAPRPLLRRALTQAVLLLLERPGAGSASLDFHSRPHGGGVELSVAVRSPDPAAAAPTSAAPRPADLSRAWNDRLECLLLRELVGSWGGTVQWQHEGAGLRVVFTLPAPR
jgi:hypothetical protein